MIDIQNLTKRFGGFTAIDNVSLKIKSGSINGADRPQTALASHSIQRGGGRPQTHGRARVHE